MNRWDVINSFIEKHNFKTYLEIGYYKGWSFDQVNCESKTAVDPNPSKTDIQQSMLYAEVDKRFEHEGDEIYCFNEFVWKMTSNDYFDQIKKYDKTWDIIFIDGLHEASQVIDDIHNSLNHLSPGGIIVMHDCNPPEYLHTTTGINGCWTGDTYKAFISAQEAYPHLHFYTIDTDWGCGIIDTNKEPIPGRNLLIREFLSNGILNKWEYFDQYRKQALNLISVEEFKTKLNEGITDNNLPT